MTYPKTRKRCVCGKEHTNRESSLCPECAFARGISPAFWERWVAAGYKDPDREQKVQLIRIKRKEFSTVKKCLFCEKEFTARSGRQMFCDVNNCREGYYRKHGLHGR